MNKALSLYSCIGVRQLLNSEFRILSESLGFYTSKQIVEYLKLMTADVNFNLAERVVDKWLRGKSNSALPIPVDIQQVFASLQSKQMAIVEREREKLKNGQVVTFKNLFKHADKMWIIHPELKGLPVTFLNQVVIRLGISLDYYENYENY